MLVQINNFNMCILINLYLYQYLHMCHVYIKLILTSVVSVQSKAIPQN